MKCNGLSVVLFLVSLGLGAWVTYERRSRTALDDKLASVTMERDALRVTANRKLALDSKTEVRADGPEGLGQEHAGALEEEAKAKNPKPKDGVKEEVEKSNPLSPMADMMKDPAMKEMMKTQMRSQLEFAYRDLFDLLGLDAGKQDKLTKMLAERAGAGMELGLAMMGGEKMSAEEKKEKTEELKASTETSDKALRELLGDADYAKFESFEKSQPERLQLSTLNSQLKENGIGLSEEAESKLMDAMFHERTNFKYDTDFADHKNFDLDKYNEAGLARYAEQQKELRARILTKAEGILSADQLQVFQKAQEQQAAMEKMGMEMGLKMMGRNKEE